MKKYLYIVLFFLLAAVFAGAFIGFGSKGTIYQDIQWGINVQKHLTILKADSNNVTDAVNKSDYSTLAISAQYIIDHTDKAIEENDQYEVSPKFQEAQKEWRMGLQDYNSSGRYLLQGATEGKSGGTGIESFQTAAQMTSSGTAHLKKASESLGINIPINLSLKEPIIKIFLASF